METETTPRFFMTWAPNRAGFAVAARLLVGATLLLAGAGAGPWLAGVARAVEVPPQDIDEKEVPTKDLMGRIEAVFLPQADLWLDARVDTGAKMCSMHARHIKKVHRDEKLYVQFDTTDDRGQKRSLLREVLYVKKVKSSNGAISERFVIKAKLRVGDREHDVEVNLNDRSSMQYKMLIGRNLLLGNYTVDVAFSHALGPFPEQGQLPSGDASLQDIEEDDQD